MNIAFSCKLLDDDLEDIFFINGDSEGEVCFQLEKAKKEIHDFIRSGMMDMTGVDLVSCSSLVQSKVSYPKSFSESNSTGFALIIRGCSLVRVVFQN